MKVSETIDWVQSYSSHLYSQLSDLTPSYSQIESSIESSLYNIPFVGSSSTQAPSPPPPPTPTNMVEALMQRADAVTGSRTRSSIAAGIGLVGISLAIVTRSAWLPKRLQSRGARLPKISNGVRQEAIIVLGLDTPLGQSLSHHLSAQGFIVLASVNDEQSKQTFDSLIPPSSRGYIKSIVLDTYSPRVEEIAQFVQSIASAKEFRWPLTSAGDPYSRPGGEVQVTGVINTLSYQTMTDQSAGLMQIDQLTRDLHVRVSTPLTVIKALLPLLTSGTSSSCTFVVSLIASNTDITSQALLAGMKKLDFEQAKEKSTSSRALLTTLEAQPSSFKSLFISLLPSRIGGAAPILQRQRQDSRAASTSLFSSRVIDTKGQSTDQQASRPKYQYLRTSSTSDVRLQRHSEFKIILEAVTSIVLQPLSTSSLRARYTIRLPAPISSPQIARTQEGESLERTMLLRLVQVSSIPFVIMGNILGQTGLLSTSWFSFWSRSACHYSGSRNSANNRPAYGPGPGPASNTHSRSCIRPSSSRNETNIRSSKRPRSANSATSSEVAQSTDSHGNVGRPNSGPPSSTATASGPPSNNGMSSSGLLSSVPSSTFGDGSEEEHFDFEDGTDSPIPGGSGPWASPVPSETDNDTALGVRRPENELEEVTPQGSSAAIDEHIQYGFPSQASMENSGDETWMGPASRASPNINLHNSGHTTSTSLSNTNTLPGTPLGQSWVAVDESK